MNLKFCLTLIFFATPWAMAQSSQELPRYTERNPTANTGWKLGQDPSSPAKSATSKSLPTKKRPNVLEKISDWIKPKSQTQKLQGRDSLQKNTSVKNSLTQLPRYKDHRKNCLQMIKHAAKLKNIELPFMSTNSEIIIKENERFTVYTDRGANTIKGTSCTRTYNKQTTEQALVKLWKMLNVHKDKRFDKSSLNLFFAACEGLKSEKINAQIRKTYHRKSQPTGSSRAFSQESR